MDTPSLFRSVTEDRYRFRHCERSEANQFPSPYGEGLGVEWIASGDCPRNDVCCINIKKTI